MALYGTARREDGGPWVKWTTTPGGRERFEELVRDVGGPDERFMVQAGATELRYATSDGRVVEYTLGDLDEED